MSPDDAVEARIWAQAVVCAREVLRADGVVPRQPLAEHWAALKGILGRSPTLEEIVEFKDRWLEERASLTEAPPTH